MDVTFKKQAFQGTPNREMVTITPTENCLVNLTETPFFIIPLSDVEHVHFERVTFQTKTFDLTFIYSNVSKPPTTITLIDIKSKDRIQDWLNLIEMTYTEGPKSMTWNVVLKSIEFQSEKFYHSEDEEGQSKPAGWKFLSAESGKLIDQSLCSLYREWYLHSTVSKQGQCGEGVKMSGLAC